VLSLIKLSLSQYNVKNLLDRRTLLDLRTVIHSHIRSSDDGNVICLDLTKIQWINSSGIDEVIGSALHLIKSNNREIFLYLEIEDNIYEHDFNLQKSLHDAELPIMAKILRDGGHIAKVFGTINAYLRNFLDLVYSSSESGITSTYASNILGTSKTMSSTSLSKLYDFRLVKRERVTFHKGYEYEYYPLF
jgi:ABC-type transporter Mla MlaB component